MTRVSRALAVAGAVVLLLTATGCSAGGAGSPTSSAGTPATDEETGSSPATPAATPAGTVVVPVQSTSDSGSPRLTVQITLGGGSPVTVMIDTGSTGLYIEQSAVGASVSSTGTTTTQHYVQSSVTAAVSTGVLTIGDASTTSDFAFGIVPDGTGTSNFGGTQGILGVAPADGDWQQTGMLSAFIQLQAPYNQGFTIDVPSGGAGTLTLGKPAPAAGSATVALTPLSPAPSAPAGVGFYEKPVNLCWTIAALASACGPTDLDTGAPRTSFNSTVVSGPVTGSGGVLDPGQAVAVATSEGTALWSFTTGTTAGSDEAVIESLGTGTDYNSGIGFFFSHVVAFDWATGNLYLTSK